MKIISTSKRSKDAFFHSQALNAVLAEVEPTFNAFQEDMNKVSDDIKSLEAYIKSINVVLPFSYKCANGFRLLWDKKNDSKEFRLLCAFGEEEVCAFGEEECRPLIEHPIATRMAVYKHLPDFTRSMEQMIKETIISVKSSPK